MPLILGAQSATAGGFSVANSCRFNRPDNPRLYRTPGSDGNRTTFTFSCWVKRCALGSFQPLWESGVNFADFDSDDTFRVGLNSGGAVNLETNRLFRDVGAWYHIVVKVDTTQGAAADRLRLYVNGVEETSFGTDVAVVQDYATDVNYTGQVMDVLQDGGGTRTLDGYAAEFVLLDGTAALPASFGEFNGDSPTIWQPIDVSGLTFGTNGLYIDFEDSADLGSDSSGNGNDLTVANLVAADQATDTPTNNFATLNPLTVDAGGAKTYSEGNTTVAETANSWTSAHSSLAVAAGKWYFESKFTLTSSTEGYFGCASVPEINAKSASTFYLGQGASIGYYTTDGNVDKDGVSTSYGSAVTTGQIVGVALDITNELAYFAINGTWQNSADPVAGSGGVAFPSGMTDGEFICLSVSPNQSYWECNFGGSSGFAITSAVADGNGYGNFEYAPPSGYFALCTKNLAEYG